MRTPRAFDTTREMQAVFEKSNLTNNSWKHFDSKSSDILKKREGSAQKMFFKPENDATDVTNSKQLHAMLRRTERSACSRSVGEPHDHPPDS